MIDPEADDALDEIKAVRLVDDAHLVPGLVKIDGYTATARVITDNFEVVPGNLRENKPANFFKFPYDWRRDNRANAKVLKKYLDQCLKQWREFTGIKDAKVILLAHSMGGLVSRYYLEVLEGWRDCKALFTFGTPYRGSVNGVNFLANGYKNQFLDLTNVLRSFPSIYQLMPIYKMLKIGDEYHRIAEAPFDLPNIVREKADDALKFHREIEDAVNSHLQDAEYQKSYKTIPMVGIQQTTLQSASFIDGQIKVSSDLPEWIDPLLSDGDGTSPYLSAIPIELSNDLRDTYFAERHGSIQNHTRVLQELRDRIKGMQIQGLPVIRGPLITPEATGQSAISLSLDDLYLADEAVEIHAKLINFQNSEGVKAQITPVSGSGAATTYTFQEQEKDWVLTIGDLEPGLYRVSVQTENAGFGAPSAVHDLFEVVK